MDDTVTLPTPDAQRPGAEGCADCVLARRDFLRASAHGALAVVAAGLGLSPAQARALAWRAITGRPVREGASLVSYAEPTADGVHVDAAHQVVLVRWQGRLYAFSSQCPHKQATLAWAPTAGRFVCPKHKSQYAPTGVHLSGRATRDMDRHPIRRTGTTVVVDTGVTYQADTAPAQWSAASVPA